MLHVTNLRTLTIGVSAVALTAAGLATLALGDADAGRGGAAAGVGAPGRAASAPADLFSGTRGRALDTSVDAFFDASLDGPAVGTSTAPAGQNPELRWALARRTGGTAGRTSSAAASRQVKTAPLLTIDVTGPVTVHVTVDGVRATADSAVRQAGETLRSARRTVNDRVVFVRNTVTDVTATVDRTVRSLPVKATVTTGAGGTDVSVSAMGASAGAHVG